MTLNPKFVLASIAITLGGIVPTSANAVQDDEPRFAQLTEQFKNPYLNLGVLLQTVADFQFDRTFTGNNGFSMANFRLALYGELDQGFGYFLQTNFAGSPSILDAYLTYAVSPTVQLSVGQQKAPFSAEFLTSAASIDFVNRSQVVTALAPGRQLGGQVRLANQEDTYGVIGGVYNGNGTAANGNDSDDLLYAARVFFNPAIGDNTVNQAQLAFSVSHSEDAGTNVSGLTSSFVGSRTLIGADARVSVGRQQFSGEILFASLDPTVGPQQDPWGFHATVGHFFSEKVQGLVRWDRFDRDGFGGTNNLIVGGLNIWPTSATEFQVNYIIDSDNAEIDQHQLLVNFQFNF